MAMNPLQNYIDLQHDSIVACGRYNVIRVKRMGSFDVISRVSFLNGKGSKRLIVKRRSNDHKLANNLTRAKSKVKELALCNEWSYFITLTIDKSKHDRFDLAGYKKKLGKFINNCNERYGYDFKYILIPEFHEDGAVHMHGLVSGIPDEELCINEYGYLDWPRYRKFFGFCSLSVIRDHIKVCYYITKYITKSLADHSEELGKHVYLCSKGLKRGEVIDETKGVLLSIDFQNRYCQVKTVDNRTQDYSDYISRYPGF